MKEFLQLKEELAQRREKFNSYRISNTIETQVAAKEFTQTVTEQPQESKFSTKKVILSLNKEMIRSGFFNRTRLQAVQFRSF